MATSEKARPNTCAPKGMGTDSWAQEREAKGKCTGTIMGTSKVKVAPKLWDSPWTHQVANTRTPDLSAHMSSAKLWPSARVPATGVLATKRTKGLAISTSPRH